MRKSLFRVALGAVLLLATPSVFAQLDVLTYRPADAQYSRLLDRLIMINGNPGQLHIYDPVTKQDNAVALSYPPTSLALSVDGRYAAVGHSQKVSYVDLSTASVTRVFDIDVDVLRLGIVAGHIYIVPRATSYNADEFLRYINVPSGVMTKTTIDTDSYYYAASGIIPRPDESGFYASSNQYTRRYDVAAGVPTRTNYTVSDCGASFLAEPDRLITNCGPSYRVFAAAAQDFKYRGSLASGATALSYVAARQEIAAIITKDSTSDLRFYDALYLSELGRWSLPSFVSGTKSVKGQGRFLFYTNDGSRLVVVQQADVSGGLLNDYGIATFTLTGACSVTLGSSGAIASSNGDSGSVSVTGTSGCKWTSQSSAPWLRVAEGVTGTGAGKMTYYALPNPDATARAATVTIGNQSFTVMQAARLTLPSTLVRLPYTVVDAQYSKSLDRLVIVSRAPNELHVYDPASKLETRTVALPLSPNTVSVSPDGNWAAVGFDAWVARVNLTNGALETPLPVNENVEDVVLGPAHIYSMGSSNSLVRTTDLATGLQSTVTTSYARRGALSHDVASLFLTNESYYGTSRWRLSSGQPQSMISSNTSSSCGEVWPSRDGLRLFTSCGTVLRLSDVPAQDLVANGSLGTLNSVRQVLHLAGRAEVYAIPNDYYYYSPASNEVQRFRYDNLAWQSTFPLPNMPVDGATIGSSGRFLFASSDETQLIVLLAGVGDANTNLSAVYTVPVASPPTCQYTISPSPIVLTANGSTVTVQVTTSPGCSWQVTSPSATWFSYWSSEGKGTGGFYLNANSNSGSERTATVTIGGQTITVRQASSCAYTVAPSSLTFPATGGAQSVSITAASGCPWTAASDNAAVTVTPSSGSGTGTVTATAAPGSTSARSGSLTIAGRSVSWAQGSSCTYSLSPANAVAVEPGGGTAQITVATGAGCTWTAVPALNAWFTAAPLSGTGPGTITITAPANPTVLPRSHPLRIVGLSYVVTQNPVPNLCVLNLNTNLQGIPAQGRSGTAILTAAGCSATTYKITSSPSWVQIYPLEGALPATITYTIYPNFSTGGRYGLLQTTVGPISVSQFGAGGTIDERFVGHIYFAFFGRYPSAAEIAFQVTQGLQQGLTRTDLVMNFFSSDEFNMGGRFTAGLYVGLLNRNAEYGGWLFQRNALATSLVDKRQLVSNFLGSAEWTGKYGTPMNAEFVRLLYRQVLLREPTQAEVDFQARALTNGTPRIDLASAFLDAAEFRAGTGPRLSAFLLYSCLLGREATPTELSSTIQALQSGTPVRTLAAAILNGAEFQSLLN